MSLTDVVPAVTTTWQSSIVCGSGEHLIAEEHDVANATPTVSGGTGASWTYRCAGPDSTSDSRTAMVMFVQFLAGTLISGPAIFGLLLILGFEIAKRRRLQASVAPPFWPQVPPDPFDCERRAVEAVAIHCLVGNADELAVVVGSLHHRPRHFNHLGAIHNRQPEEWA